MDYTKVLFGGLLGWITAVVTEIAFKVHVF